jgi:hypothetical protein
VNHTTLKSVVSDAGMMLTHVRLDMVPGDKRLLHLTLPPKAHFWFAFVNQGGVAPWLDQDRILIPLEQQSKPDDVIAVEIFYSSNVGDPKSRRLDLSLLGPKFDLPLEDITWHVFLNEKWNVTDWKGTLQLSEKAWAQSSATIDLESYLQKEQALRTEKTKVAEQQLQLGAAGIPKRLRSLAARHGIQRGCARAVAQREDAAGAGWLERAAIGHRRPGGRAGGEAARTAQPQQCCLHARGSAAIARAQSR